MTRYVIYSRKSQEDKDKQVQSIPAQEDEMTSLAAKWDIPVVNPLLSEAKSAKAPGRPVFNAMMDRVERGEILGILCWKLDRLARNPVDGGRIIWAIKQHGLVVRTPLQTFSQGCDNLLLMYIEFGMAHKYVDDLGRVTTRGLEKKARLGWCPGVARLGYLNSKVEERGQKTVLRDPERFDAVRRMWDLMLSGNYSPARIQKIATREWGLRTRPTKKHGAKPVSRSTVYKIFSDHFYYGRYEYPKGSGCWFDGQHQPMITEAEFNRVQKLLHRDTNTRPQTPYPMPFRGLIKCGECNSSITAHVKEQIRCPQCHFKSSVKNHGACFKCGLPMTEMRGATLRRYSYYHCTRSLNASCRQKSVSAAALEKQVTRKLKCYGLPRELQKWGLRFIEKLREQDMKEQTQILAERKKAHDQCAQRLANLVTLKTSPENTGGCLLTDEEYQKQRAEILAKKNALASDLFAFENKLERKTRILRDSLNLAGKIEEPAFDKDTARKREILGSLGLNHVLKEKELEIKPEFPFSDLPSRESLNSDNPAPIEPDNNQDRQGQNLGFRLHRPNFERLSDEDRTKRLKHSLETIWKKCDPESDIINRFPFSPGEPMIPPRRRNQGRFI